MLIDKWKEHFEQEIKETNIILQKGYTGSIKHAARQKIDDYKLFLSCLKELTEAVTELERLIDGEIEAINEIDIDDPLCHYKKQSLTWMTGEAIEQFIEEKQNVKEGLEQAKQYIKQTLGGGS